MTISRVGEVVSVEFPFTDMLGRKRRPGVVLASDASDVLLARITTHEPRHELSFGREANDRARHLDEAQAAWHHAATAIRQSNEVHAHLLEALVPLRDDPRC